MDWTSFTQASALSGVGLPHCSRTFPSAIFGRQRGRPQCRNARWHKRTVPVTAAAPPAHAQQAQLKPTARGFCYGCGLQLQTQHSSAAGFVDPTKYAIKRQHRQLDTVVCERCQQLSNGHMVPAVEDFSSRNLTGVQLAGKMLISPDQLRAHLKGLSEQRILAVLVVDLLDCSGSFLNRVRDLIGRNPVLLVGTKADLLPKGTDLAKVEDWLLSTAGHRRLNVVSAHLVGSPAGQGVSQTASAMLRERKGRSVYVMGAANVGKSSFIRALVKEMSKMTSKCFQPTAKAQARRLPVESAMPGTTLQTIELKAFATTGSLFDTPGVHLHHRLPHLLSPEELKKLHPRRRLNPYYAPTPESLTPQEDEKDFQHRSSRPVSATYQWGGLARIDIVSAPSGTGLIFYGPPALYVTALPLLGEEELIQSAATDAAQLASSPEATAVLPDSAQHAQHAQHAQSNSNGAGAQPNQEPVIASQPQQRQMHNPWNEDRPNAEAVIEQETNRASHGMSQDSRQAPASAQSKSSPSLLDGYESALHWQRQQQQPQQQQQQQQRQIAQDRWQTEFEFQQPSMAASEQQQPAVRQSEEEEGLFGEGSVQQRGALRVMHKVIPVSRQRGALVDIAISGLPGWITVMSPGVTGEIQLRLWVPVGVEVFVRPPMPVDENRDKLHADPFW